MADQDLTKPDPLEIPDVCPTPGADSGQWEQFSFAMDLLSHRWMGQVLRVLLDGSHRFNEILEKIPGISDPLLTQRLRELVINNLAVRKVSSCSPVRVDYTLTDAGHDLGNALRAIAAWAYKWRPRSATK
jgi:DNA-binding HxlR family transcriptional regulator